MQKVARWHLRRGYGLKELEFSGMEHLEASLKAGHSVLLAPNHCRPADPFVVLELARRAGVIVHTMASAHLFMNSAMQAWVLHRAGVFSVYREGMDRQAIAAAVEILRAAQRPLVIFPEGVVTRSNDRLNALMEGTAFIARSAAKKRAEESPAGKVVIHPVALKYLFRGDIKTALEPTIEELELRLAWRPQRQLPLLDRITKIGVGLLSLKEIEFLGEPYNGTVPERVQRLVNYLLVPLEKEWLNGHSDDTVVGRVKKLRVAVLPGLIDKETTPAERDRRWQQLADMYLAQQLSLYPPDYLRSQPSPERMLETVERFEEDLTDKCRVYRPMAVKVRVGEAIPVSPARDRSAAEDPAMSALEKQLHDMLGGDPVR
jgi:hypothetical protein